MLQQDILSDPTLDPSSQAITLTDFSLPDNPLVYINKGFEHLTGYTREEVTGRNCRFLQGPETNRGAVKQLGDAISEGRSTIVDILNYRKDGSTFWNRISVLPVTNDKGVVTHFIGLQTDITHMRELERRLYGVAQSLGGKFTVV